MSHSHLAVRHLIRQLELRPRGAAQKPTLPDWLRILVDQLSQRFEPFQGLARVGYECTQDDGVWELALFLGERESIGGPADGQQRPVNFRYQLDGLPSLFDSITSLAWNAFPHEIDGCESVGDLSFIVISGIVNGQSVRVKLQARASEDAGPGLRQHHDGRVELA